MLDTLKKLNMDFPPITWDPATIKIED
jgi:hypothetical protein